MTYTTVRVAGTAALAALLAAHGDALAGRGPRRRVRREPSAIVAETPLGLQGLAGAGANVVIPFVLIDSRQEASDVEAQFAVDANGDGVLTDDEFRPATEDRLDPRNTRANRAPQVFPTGTGIGAVNAFVWRSTTDLGTGRFVGLRYLLTDQGRLIADPAYPGAFLFDYYEPGACVRVRAFTRVRRRRVASPWSYTDLFALDNGSAPRMRIDAVTPSEDRSVVIAWTAHHPDSEDANGNGIFDPGEDFDGDGIFGQVQVGVAFDVHLVGPGEDVGSMSASEIADLAWLPCARAAGLGDSDSFREPAPAAGGPDTRVFAARGGRSWTFVWDADADVGDDPGPYLLRARCVDQKKRHSEFVYVVEPFTR